MQTLVSLFCGRKNSCGKKIDYKSQASAERAAKKVAIKFGRPFEGYECWFCRGWHIGGAFNLTWRKFFRIAWFWMIKRKTKAS
jgi:hypothetical protein